MPKQNASPPTMQDPDDSTSLIARAFARLTPPATPFEPAGDWRHEYHDISSHRLQAVQGGVTLQRRAGEPLRIESFRNCPNGYRYTTIAELNCRDDELSTPASWQVESKVAKSADSPAYLNSGLRKDASVTDGILTLQEGGKQRRIDLPGKYTCKWCLLDAVARLPELGTEKIEFTLIDEYDELCPNQVIRFRGKAAARTRAGTIEVSCYQHTGVATMPGVFYVDGGGRVLLYLAGMELLALASADGKATGYLK